jgi:YHS domain-containing protein
MQNRFSKTILTLACLLAFAWTSVFAQTKDVPKTTPVKKQVECKADTSKMPCPMDKAKMDSCCMKEGQPCKHMKMQGCCSDSSKKPCPMEKAKMDSCCKKEGKPGMHMQRQGCASDSLKKPCPMEKTKMKKEGKASIQQKTCPVTGEPADQNVFLDYQGKRFYFCCAACKEKFQESPQTYLKKTK